MLNLSYTLSPILRERLREIEDLRIEILKSPIPPQTEIRLKWETMISRIHSSNSLSGITLDKKQIAKILTAQINLDKGENLKNLSQEERDVIGYKRSLDLIARDWNGQIRLVTARDVLLIYDTFGTGRSAAPISAVQELLDYLQAHKENPVVQAGVCCLGIESIRPFSGGNGRLARLISYLFLYKSGFDIRGLIQIEKNWAKDPTVFQEALRIGINAASITLWLEFFAGSILYSLSETMQKIADVKIDNIGLDNSFWDLNDRQKEILILLQDPDSIITNKKVQKRFKVSQITASRDLSKLATLGYIFQRGKGRSVYYTKF